MKLTCALCGLEFHEEDSQSVCMGCPLRSGRNCGLVKCPNCGYENLSMHLFYKPTHIVMKSVDSKNIQGIEKAFKK